MLRRVQPGQPLGLERGRILVCIPVFGAPELVARCLESVLQHTDPAAPILIADDCSPDGSFAEQIDADHTLFYWRQESNVGFPRNCNDAFASAAPADVVVLNSDCEVAAGWLDGLRDAAYSDTVVASATPLTNHGTIVSIPDRNQPRPDLPAGVELQAAAASIRSGSLRLRPRLPTAIGHCTYFKRSALELVGPFDEAYSPGYGEEVDWSQRCVLRGLQHVVADDVLVLHHGSASFGSGTARNDLQAAHDRLNAQRFPYYLGWVKAEAEAEFSQLARVINHSRRLLEGISVTIDGSNLGPTVTGTQVLTLETILALHRHGGMRVRVVVPRSFGDFARATLEPLRLETLVWEDLTGKEPATDIVHRPAQIGRVHEVDRLRALGRYMVLSQLDFIAYRNPGYFDTFDEWHAYRSATARALAVADGVLFISEHSRDEGIAEGLLPPARAHVVHPGVDHHMVRDAPVPQAPPWAGEVGGRYLLCFGTDFRHKNRLFALDLQKELVDRHGWDGRLVLAGPQASPGSSWREEEAWLRDNPAVANTVTRLGELTDPERRWLLAGATLVVSPSVYEGFGLVPFEAAEAGVATLFAPQASLAEVLPAEAALLVPWDVAASAEAAKRLLDHPEERSGLVACIARSAERYTWDGVAAQLASIYEQVAAQAPVGAWIASVESPPHAPSDFRLLVPGKVLRYWRQFGVAGGTVRGLRALRNRLLRRRERARPAR